MRYRIGSGVFLAIATIAVPPVWAQGGEAEDEVLRLAMARLALYENSPLLEGDLGTQDNLLGDLLFLTRKSLARSRSEGILAGKQGEIGQALLRGRHESTSELADALVSRGVSEAMLTRVKEARVPGLSSDPFDDMDTWAHVVSTIARTPVVLTQEARGLPGRYTVLEGISLREVSLERSLQILLAGRGLWYRVRDKVVIDAPDRVPTELRQVHDLTVHAIGVLPMLATPGRESTSLLEELTGHYDARIAEAASTALEQIRESRKTGSPPPPHARFALARLALYENSSVPGIVGPDAEVLQDLFRETREILNRIRSEGHLEPPLERSIVDILLEGRDAAISWGHEYGGAMAETPKALRSRLDRSGRVHIWTRGLPLDQLVGFFSARTGIPVAISSEVRKLAPERKTLGTKDASSALEYLQFIADNTGVTYRIVSDALVMVLPDRVPTRAVQVRDLAREAITVLGLLGSVARDVFPVLEKLATSLDPQIAARAKSALRQIRR